MIQVLCYHSPYEDKDYYYNVIEYSSMTDADFKRLPKSKVIKKKKSKGSKVLDIGCGFDIETSSIPDKHLAFMYIWQMSLDNIVIYGRTWDEWIEFLDKLKKYYNISKEKRLIIWVHNLSFEFQFIKKKINWDIGRSGWTKIFALDPRKIVKAEADGYEFRDSLVLTNLSLAKLAKDFKLPHQKLAGDLDYKILRFQDSDLSIQELAYCFNDVLILSDFFHYYIKPQFIDKNIKLPLTSTGILRNELKVMFNKINILYKNKYKNEISKAFPTLEEYQIMMEWLFRGGYVHSAPGLTDEVLLYTLGSFDFKSAYPAVMLQELYPWQFVECDPSEASKMLDKRITKNEAYYGYFEIKNIKSKGQISYESSNKIVEYVNARWDNGRLWSADKIRVWLNEYDLMIYKDVYIIESVTCLKLYKSVKKPLPDFLKNLILKYFVQKEEIGKRDKESIEYKNAKSKLNSFYGMICTALYFMEYHYNPAVGIVESVISDKEYNELIDNQILLPQWGIWVTAITRYRLIHYGFNKLQGQAVYGDTDSIKVLNYIENKYVFDNFNNMIRRINSKMYVGRYDRKLFMNLGTFDFEEKMLKFKCLGAKRYLFSYSEKNKKSGKYEIRNTSTIAGMKKGTLEDYAIYHNKDIYECFKDGLILDLTRSKKLTSIYCDEGFDEYLEGHQLHEDSCVALISIPFELSLTDDYLAFLQYIKETNQNRLIKKKYVNMFY